MTLDKACKAFEDWRANKSSRQEHIPAHLWGMVKALVPHYQRSTICSALHLSGGQFKQHCRAVKPEVRTVAINDGFVETLIPTRIEECELALQGSRKTLSIKIQPQHLSIILPLLEAYL